VATSADPETYLRLIWERPLLLGDDQNNSMQEFPYAMVVSRALVAAGRLDQHQVEAIRDEYMLAMSLRQRFPGHIHIHHMAASQGEGTRLSAQRIVMCHADFTVGDEHRTLERVLFADDTTRFDLSGLVAPAVRGGTSRRMVSGLIMVGGMQPMHPHPQSIAVTDNFGTTATAHPGGASWNDQSWQSTYTSDVPLSADTAWIEIDEIRFALPERSPIPEASVEPIEQIDPMRSMLYKEILGTDRRHGGGDSVDVAISALVATGSLKEDDSLVTEIRRIAAAVASGAPVPNLPEPWSSLMRRFTKSDGPSGSVGIGAAIDSVDGYSIRFDSLTSEPTSFSLSLAVSPGQPLLMHFPGTSLERSAIDWWAQDDRSNTYVLFSGRGSGSSEVAEGEVHSMAPLDPKATVLRLLPTGAHERGVVDVPLRGLGES